MATRYMEEAIREAYRGIGRAHGGPFGAVIVKGSRIIAKGHNEVLKTNDATRHAECCAITRAGKKLGSHHLKGCDIYSTTEPCVMCFAAIHWAQIRRIYFGTSIQDVARLGFNELVVSNRRLRTLAGSDVEIVPGVLREACRELLVDWKASPNPEVY